MVIPIGDEPSGRGPAYVVYGLSRGRFIVFYLLCGLAASVAQILFSHDSVVPSLGASGAIAGVLGPIWSSSPEIACAS